MGDFDGTSVGALVGFDEGALDEGDPLKSIDGSEVGV